MKLCAVLRYFGLLLAAALLLPALGSAQQTFKCEANNDNRKYCGNYRPDEVRLQRQISGSPCIEGQTWGVDRQGLWVERGCRAIFEVGRFGGPGYAGPRRGASWAPPPCAHGP